jgi:uncharacterized protein (UPF0335 family)
LPKRAKIDDDIGGERVLDDETKATANSKGAQLLSFLERYERVQDDIDRILQDAKDECLPGRDDQAVIAKEAAEAGFSKKEFKTLLRKRRLEKKLEHVADSLDDGQRETYDQFLHALGELSDLPLGQAAADKHPDRRALAH